MVLFSWWRIPDDAQQAWNQFVMGLGGAWFPLFLYLSMRNAGVLPGVRIFFIITGLILLTITIPGISFLVHSVVRERSLKGLWPSSRTDAAITVFLAAIYFISLWRML